MKQARSSIWEIWEIFQYTWVSSDKYDNSVINHSSLCCSKTLQTFVLLWNIYSPFIYSPKTGFVMDFFYNLYMNVSQTPELVLSMEEQISLKISLVVFLR